MKLLITHVPYQRRMVEKQAYGSNCTWNDFWLFFIVRRQRKGVWASKRSFYSL